MKKKDLIDSLSNLLSARSEAKAAVETIFSAIRQALREGDRVVISELGTFSAYVARAKMARNPNTGEKMHIAPKKKVRFRQSKDLFK